MSSFICEICGPDLPKAEHEVTVVEGPGKFEGAKTPRVICKKGHLDGLRSVPREVLYEAAGKSLPGSLSVSTNTHRLQFGLGAD